MEFENLDLAGLDLHNPGHNLLIAVSQRSSAREIREFRFWLDSKVMEASIDGHCKNQVMKSFHNRSERLGI
jgi:hypothetical protein